MIKFLLFFGVAAVLLLPLLLAIVSAVIFGLWRALTYETRFRRFFVKYANDEIARMIASGRVWTGQTAEQLRDAKGAPARIEAAAGSEIWVYQGKALTPSGLRITLQNDRVANWA